MRTYRQLFALAEFTPLFTAVSTKYAGGTMESIAVAILVYDQTGSPLLSALSMFGPSAVQVVGAFTLLSLADRVRPRTALTFVSSAYCLLTLVTAIPGLPIWAIMVTIFGAGLVSAFGAGIQWGLMREIVPPEGYLLGRSAFTIATGVTQMAGYGLGGVLAATVSARATLVIAAALFACSAALTRFRLTDRPPRASDRASVRATARDNRLLFSSPHRRATYFALWVPNGLVVGCEALFVPYSPRLSGLLLSGAALGMLFGDLLVGRVLGGRAQRRLAAPLRLLLAAPYLLFAWSLPIALATAAVVIASVGYAAGLLLQEQLLALTPAELTGHAMGLHSAGMLSLQAICATIAGVLARATSIHVAIVGLAGASIAVTLALGPALRRAQAAAVAETRPVGATVG